MNEEVKNQKSDRLKTFVGTVTSNKMRKTIVVQIERQKKHPKYGKFFKVIKKFKVDCTDERLYSIGSKVVIIECKPISKEKKFRVLQSETENLNEQK